MIYLMPYMGCQCPTDVVCMSSKKSFVLRVFFFKCCVYTVSVKNIIRFKDMSYVLNVLRMLSVNFEHFEVVI